MTTMYFENKEMDPRDCLYRANPEIRKQIEQVIKVNKIKFELIKSNDSKDDKIDQQIKNSTSVKNRFKKSKPKNDKVTEETTKEDDKENLDDNLLMSKFSKDNMISFVDQLESILRHEEEQKQTFNYETLVKMHQLLQYLEDEDDKHTKNKTNTTIPSFRTQYFFQFMESNFRMIPPEKRKNQVLDERLRKLKFQAANHDYDDMTVSIGRAIRAGQLNNKANNSKFTLSQEMRNIRSTLLATVNAFMVIVATFVFFYFAFSYARPNDTIANRVLFSFFASMVVAVAEVYFLIRII